MNYQWILTLAWMGSDGHQVALWETRAIFLEDGTSRTDAMMEIVDSVRGRRGVPSDAVVMFFDLQPDELGQRA